jgi:hypothetical protein
MKTNIRFKIPTKRPDRTMNAPSLDFTLASSAIEMNIKKLAISKILCIFKHSPQ